MKISEAKERLYDMDKITFVEKYNKVKSSLVSGERILKSMGYLSLEEISIVSDIEFKGAKEKLFIEASGDMNMSRDIASIVSA